MINSASDVAQAKLSQRKLLESQSITKINIDGEDCDLHAVVKEVLQDVEDLLAPVLLIFDVHFFLENFVDLL
jgi:hypothetical protein